MITDELKSVLNRVSQTAGYSGIAVDDVTTRGMFGETPLHAVAVWGDVEAGRILLAAGADANAIGEDGDTPLHEAIIQEHLPFVEFLLANGADPNIKNEDGQTAFALADTFVDSPVRELLNRKRDAS